MFKMRGTLINIKSHSSLFFLSQHRPLREDLLVVQRPEDSQEKDPREEKDLKSGFQRVVCLRAPAPGGGTEKHQPGVHAS